MTMRERAERTIRRFYERRPNAFELARVASLAVRVDAALLRALRIDLLRGVPAGAEADVWFSPLVAAPGATGFVFDRGVCDLLRLDLAQDQTLLRRAYDIVSEVHSGAPPSQQIEERLIYYGLLDDPGSNDELTATFYEALAALTANKKRGGEVARWAARALPGLPANAQTNTAAHLLDVGSAARLRGAAILDRELTRFAAPATLRHVLPRTSKKKIGIRVYDGVFEIVESGRDASTAIEVPDVPGSYLTLKWRAYLPREGRRTILAQPGERVSIPRNRRELLDDALERLADECDLTTAAYYHRGANSNALLLTAVFQRDPGGLEVKPRLAYSPLISEAVRSTGSIVQPDLEETMLADDPAFAIGVDGEDDAHGVFAAWQPPPSTEREQNRLVRGAKRLGKIVEAWPIRVRTMEGDEFALELLDERDEEADDDSRENVAEPEVESEDDAKAAEQLRLGTFTVEIPESADVGFFLSPTHGLTISRDYEPGMTLRASYGGAFHEVRVLHVEVDPGEDEAERLQESRVSNAQIAAERDSGRPLMAVIEFDSPVRSIQVLPRLRERRSLETGARWFTIARAELDGGLRSGTIERFDAEDTEVVLRSPTPILGEVTDGAPIIVDGTVVGVVSAVGAIDRPGATETEYRVVAIPIWRLRRLLDEIPYDAYFSYHPDDRDAANELAEALRDRGLRIWTPESELSAGKDWKSSETTALTRSKSAVLFFSESRTRWKVDVDLDVATKLAETEPAFDVLPVVFPPVGIEHLPAGVRTRQIYTFDSSAAEKLADEIFARIARPVAAEDATEEPEATDLPTWKEAIEAIRSSKQYDGLELKPQDGLQPLGPDPESGLWEFLHVETGEPPERDSHGRTVPTAAMGIVLVLLPGGRFWMGSQKPPVGATTSSVGGGRPFQNQDPDSRENERPVHEVELSPFFIAKYQLTEAQWSRSTAMPSSEERSEGTTTAKVEPKSQNALEYCATQGLTLPTEAQWEYACRAGTYTPYSGTGNLDEMGWYEKNSGDRIHNVGEKRPNHWGLYDVHGNVWEWCVDQFDHEFYSREEATRRDPTCDEGRSGGRVLRGGGFDDFAELTRSAFRIGDAPEARNLNVGFRPVRTID